MKASITKHNMPNSVNIYLPKNIRNKIKEEVVVSEIDGCLNIRESVIDDYKTLKIKKTGHITYSSENAKTLIGGWNVEIDGDFFIFSSKI